MSIGNKLDDEGVDDDVVPGFEVLDEDEIVFPHPDRTIPSVKKLTNNDFLFIFFPPFLLFN